MSDSAWSKPVPADVARIPGMLSDEEKRYLYWLTREAYQGWGAIVDLGPWVGSSSAALAAGLRDRGLAKKVRSFDRFEWNRIYMERHMATGLPEGASFLPVFLRETAPVRDWLAPEKMDLFHGTWDGGPIEILFVDAAKSWELSDAILRTFGPFLTPGKSRVVQQDFRHFHTTWLPLVIDSRPDLWQQIEAVDDGCTVTFVPRRELFGAGGLPSAHRAEDFTYEQVERIFAARVDAERLAQNKLLFRMGWFREALLRGKHGEAEALRSAIEADGAAARRALVAAEVAIGFEVMNAGRVAEALRIGQRAFAADPTATSAASLAGICAIRLGQRPIAESCFEAVVARDPADVNALLHLADIHRERGQIAESGRRVDAALAQLGSNSGAPLIAWALRTRESAWEVGGAWPSGDLPQLRATFDGNADFHLLSARCHWQTGDHAAAQRELARCLAIAPKHARAAALAQVTSARAAEA